MKVLSTYKILKSKAFNESINEGWIDWAMEMIEAGYESENLYMLAGQLKPYNQFELHELANKVLQDLNLDYSDRDAVIKNYIHYLLSTSIGHPETYYRTLRELKDIYDELDMDSRYIDFSLLYYAKEDLTMDEVQWYWEGASRDNIDEIIKEKFEEWLEQFQS